MLAAAVLAVLALVGIAISVAIERRDRVRRMPKLIASLSYALFSQVHENPEPLERELIKGDPAVWRELDAAEREWLVDTVVRREDIGPGWKEEVMTDRWNHSVRVEVRRPPERLEFRVTSAGPDGRFGTPDDIGCTTEEGAPQQLRER
jgi:hypothetical protein